VKVIPFGLETFANVNTGTSVVLCCGEEDALSLRPVGYTALSQPGAGLLKPVYSREMAGLGVVVLYDAGEASEARRDAQKLLEAGAESVRVAEWAADAPNGADVNGKLVEDPQGFARWAAGMIEGTKPVSRERANPSAMVCRTFISQAWRCRNRSGRSLMMPLATACRAR